MWEANPRSETVAPECETRFCLSQASGEKGMEENGAMRTSPPSPAASTNWQA